MGLVRLSFPDWCEPSSWEATRRGRAKKKTGTGASWLGQAGLVGRHPATADGAPGSAMAGGALGPAMADGVVVSINRMRGRACSCRSSSETLRHMSPVEPSLAAACPCRGCMGHNCTGHRHALRTVGKLSATRSF